MRLLVVLFAVTACCAQNIDARIDVGGRKLHLLCMGRGSPTVLLEAGMGDFSAAWMPVQRRMATNTRVCSYDRAGLGDSDQPTQKPVTSNAYVRDLHALLATAKIVPPYVLVGHSMGGILVRLYAKAHPAEVLGMVLVDSSHEPLPGRGFIGGFVAAGNERLDFLNVMRAATDQHWTADIPLTVLARRQSDDEFPPQATAARKAEIQRMNEDEQRDLASRSPRGKIVWVQDSGHYIQR
jgi:pimeloyl-ACP methyl ester carboxylesterase